MTQTKSSGKFHEVMMLADSDGTVASSNNPFPVYSSNIPGLDIAAGSFTDFTHVNKFGANLDINGSSSPESIWSHGTLYPWSAFDGGAKNIFVKSDDAADTGTLKVQGLDENYDEQEETVTLTGTSAVQLTNTYVRIFRMEYTSASGPNAGKITCHASTSTGTVVAAIEDEDGQTLMCIYTIPAGYEGYLTSLDVSVNKAKDAQIRLYNRAFNKSFRISHICEVYQSQYRYDFNVPIKFDEKTDIDLRAYDVLNNNTKVSAAYAMVIRQKNG